jgi:hypothetical protein
MLGVSDVADNDEAGRTVDPPPLPNGHFIQVASAGSEIGGRVWPCAAVLTHYLRGRANELVRGATVIELGAGVGLCALYAAGLGARQALLTDVLYRGDGADATPNELGPTLRHNIERNRSRCGLLASMDVAELNFGVPAHADACRALSDGGEGFDLALGSDGTLDLT